MNCKIHPILYNYYLRLRDSYKAEMVHRRKRRSNTCIEIIFYAEQFKVISGRLNTLREAEKCGYWIISRPKSNTFYDNHLVHLLFLTPVHPKKRRMTEHTITPLIQNNAVAMTA